MLRLPFAGNNCDMLIITTFGSDPETIKNRKGIVISSRVHPGETGASWMMKGILDYLLAGNIKSKILRDNFVFKVIPMLNVDGVVNGSSRCNLAGVDLNRVWIDPSRKLHPTVYHMKNMVKKFQEDRDVFLVCDLHGQKLAQEALLRPPHQRRQRPLLSRECSMSEHDLGRKLIQGRPCYRF